MAVKRGRVAAGPTGERTRRRILDAARRLLTARGHVQFSMRNVAATARLHLANVQYYFPRREILVRELLHETGERYRASYQRLLARAGADPRMRLEAVLAFSLRDIADAATRRYFTQLWALLDRLDGGTGTLLDELYRTDLEQIAERVSELFPALDAREVRLRATTLAALIEGAMLVRGAHASGARAQARLRSRLYATALGIATGHPSLQRRNS